MELNVHPSHPQNTTSISATPYRVDAMLRSHGQTCDGDSLVGLWITSILRHTLARLTRD